MFLSCRPSSRHSGTSGPRMKMQWPLKRSKGGLEAGPRNVGPAKCVANFISCNGTIFGSKSLSYSCSFRKGRRYDLDNCHIVVCSLVARLRRVSHRWWPDPFSAGVRRRRHCLSTDHWSKCGLKKRRVVISYLTAQTLFSTLHHLLCRVGSQAKNRALATGLLGNHSILP